MRIKGGFEIGRRGVLLSGLAAFALLTLSRPAIATENAPRVLFVCQAGTVKSAIARELFRRRALERGIAVTAFSRGITPEEHVSPELRERLVADGIDSTRDGLLKLTREDLEAADIVVVFNALPETLARSDALDWTASPSMNDSYSLARADLDRRIESLLDSIRDGSPAK